MEERKRVSTKAMSRTVAIDGATLHVVAKQLSESEWELYVENERGIRSAWTDFYTSGEAAIGAGIEAIEIEGVEPFLDNEGFDYQLE